MHIRDPDGRARHFVHNSGGTDCSGVSEGESETHERCVALAVAALVETFGEQAERIAPEVDVDVSMSGSGHRVRRADALVEFVDLNVFFGEGLAVEVQHRHEDKDVRLTTHDYLSAGHSVVWVDAEEFGDEALDWAVVEAAFADDDEGGGYRAPWHSPHRFIACEHYQYEQTHRWGTVPSSVLTVEEEYDVCVDRYCGQRRRYDAEGGEYVYGIEAIPEIDLPPKFLKHTLVDHHPYRSFDEWLRETFQADEAVGSDPRGNPLEKALASRPEIAACPGPKGIHEWNAPKEKWAFRRNYPVIGLRECQHCSTHLLTNLKGYADERQDIFFERAPDPEWNLTALTANPRQCENWYHKTEPFDEHCPTCGVY
jgi:hypothetical protein